MSETLGLWWTLAIVILGGVAWAAASATGRGTPAVHVKRPGWVARRRARRGIRHKRGQVGVGYASATSAAYLTGSELAHHGAVFGAPGSGKTTFLRLLIEASADQIPVVVIDPKGSPALAETVRASDGQVWTLDGRLSADLLDPRPWQVPELLLEGEDYSADARAYRDAAHQRALWAAWALALRGERMDLARLRTLLDRTALRTALEPFRAEARVADWLDKLERQHGGVEDSGARGLDRSLGTLLDGVAMRGSLHAGPDSLRLEDVLETRGVVLFSLDAATYPHATRKVAAWVLLAMSRLARELSGETEPRALLIVDEVGALGSAARHLRGLVGRAREAGLSVVMATQGPSDLEAVDHALLSQTLQDTAWQVAFRQGSPRDAEHMRALFGETWQSDVTSWSDGRRSSRRVERPRVAIDEWLNGLQPADAWLRVAPVDGGWRQQRIRVALPQVRKTARKTLSETIGKPRAASFSEVPQLSRPGGFPMPEDDDDVSGVVHALPAVPPDCPEHLLTLMGADMLAKTERRWPKRHHELGPCLVWKGATLKAAAGYVYGRQYVAAAESGKPKGESDAAHRVVWRRCYGPIPDGLDVDHRCEVSLCVRPDHLRLLTKGDNTRRARRHAANRRTQT